MNADNIARKRHYPIYCLKWIDYRSDMCDRSIYTVNDSTIWQLQYGVSHDGKVGVNLFQLHGEGQS